MDGHVFQVPSLFLFFFLFLWLSTYLRTYLSMYQKWPQHGVLVTFWLGHVRRAASAFFEIYPSKNGPEVFSTFWLVLSATTACTFRHLPKWSANGMSCTFWLGNVLFAATACNFSTSELPKIWSEAGVLCAFLLGSNVHSFISSLAKCLRTRRLSEPTLQPPGATNHWKHDFPNISRTCLFLSSDSFYVSLLLFSLLLFYIFYSSLSYSYLLSDSSHLCFSSLRIVGGLTSKLPLIIYMLWYM